MSKKNYVKGFYANNPAGNAPDFVRMNIKINLPKFRQWLSENLQSGAIKDKDGDVRLQVHAGWNEGDDNSVVLDTWEPKNNGSAMPEFAAKEEELLI